MLVAPDQGGQKEMVSFGGKHHRIYVVLHRLWERRTCFLLFLLGVGRRKDQMVERETMNPQINRTDGVSKGESQTRVLAKL